MFSILFSSIRFLIGICAVGFIWIWVVQSADDQLIFVHALFRHGVRAPVHLMPKDAGNPERSWRQGLGELQSEGMRQMYELGQTLRERYVRRYGFLSETYKVNEIFFRSSDVNRTITSALFAAAGLYEDRTGLVSDWKPIPFHTWPAYADPVLAERAENCPRLHEMDVEFEKSAFIKALAEENKEFLRFLANESGFPSVTPINVSRVFDTLRCELTTHDHYWPDWVNRSVYDRAASLYRTVAIRQQSDFERIRLVGGMLVKDITDRLKEQPAILQNDENRLKFFAFSGHDSNIFIFLAALDYISKSSFNPPDFASCILLELWQNTQYGRYIKVFYRSNSTEEFVAIPVSNCGQPCRLEVFESIMRRFIPDDLALECGAKQRHDWQEASKFLIAIFSFAIFVLLAVITGLVTLLLQRQNHRYGNYRPVDNSVVNRLLDDDVSDSEFSSLEFVDMKK